MSRVERDTQHATITVDAIDDLADVEVRLLFKPMAMLIPRHGPMTGAPAGPYARATNEQIAAVVAHAVSNAISKLNWDMRDVEACSVCGCVQPSEMPWYESIHRPGVLLCGSCHAKRGAQ